MGFFSWQTSDKNESILNEYSGGEGVDIYLLQPDGNHIKESNYNGYGNFGGVDAYAWLARMNLPKEQTEGKTDEEIRGDGIHLDSASGVYRDKDTGQLYTFHGHPSHPEAKPFTGNYGTKQPDYDLTPNELNESGQWVEIAQDAIKYPLKFSHDKDAVYAVLPAAENCPNQGHSWG